MNFDGANLENIIIFFLFFQVWPFLIAKFNKKKCEISAAILKFHSLVKSLTLRLIKLDKNSYLKSITVYL